MAVSGTDQVVDESLREGLKTTISGSIDEFNAVVGGYTGMFQGIGLDLEFGSSLAGVTPTMATNIVSALETYKGHLETTLSKMQSPEVNQAFKGSELESATKRFVESVINLAKSYIERLTEAQTQIINSVYETYGVQISELSSSVTSDANAAK